MKQFFSRESFGRAQAYALAHKKTSVAGAIIVLLILYWGYGKLTSTAGETRYVLSTVEKTTLITSITGSGQVSASNQIDVKAKASGDVVYVGVKEGDTVKAGTLIAQLDATDAIKAVRDAEVNLQSAQIALQKLQAPADNLSTIQAQNALDQASTTLEKAYDDGFNTVAQTFLDLPTVMTGLDGILYNTTISHGSQDNISAYNDMVKNYDETSSVFRDDVVTKYKAARVAYTQNIADFKTVSRTSDRATIEKIINETYATTKSVADAVKSTNDFLNFVKDRLTVQQKPSPAEMTTSLTSLSTYTNQTSSHLLDLLNIKNTISDSKFGIAEKTASLKKLQDGADSLDLESQNLSVTQRENALADARENLSNYYIRAPFDGTVGKVSVKRLDTLSNGAVAATLVTPQQIAEISLNEVDVAKVKIGQKVNMTFDAVDGLTITGVVSEIDTIGTVSQGVVTYTVKINFDTQDERIKPGMSVSAVIITDVKTDVLTVPSSAIKMSGNSQYVEMFKSGLPADATSTAGFISATLPDKQVVITGVSNDTDTEITSGLSEGDLIVTRTTVSTTATKATPSLLSAVGGNRGASGATRSATGR